MRRPVKIVLRVTDGGFVRIVVEKVKKTAAGVGIVRRAIATILLRVRLAASKAQRILAGTNRIHGVIPTRVVVVESGIRVKMHARVHHRRRIRRVRLRSHLPWRIVDEVIDDDTRTGLAAILHHVPHAALIIGQIPIHHSCGKCLAGGCRPGLTGHDLIHRRAVQLPLDDPAA